MIVEYIYRSTGGKFGWYQCDVGDFKKMMANKTFQRNLYWVIAKVEDKVWSYSMAVKKWRKLRAVPYYAK